MSGKRSRETRIIIKAHSIGLVSLDFYYQIVAQGRAIWREDYLVNLTLQKVSSSVVCGENFLTA